MMAELGFVMGRSGGSFRKDVLCRADRAPIPVINRGIGRSLTTGSRRVHGSGFVVRAGTVGLGHTVKFLCDRANAALDRRAQRRAAVPPESKGGATAEATTGQTNAAENEIIAAMEILKAYLAKNFALEPDDVVLLDTVHRLHAALERFEGAPVDVDAAVRSHLKVDQSSDNVHGMMTGVEVDGSIPDATSAHTESLYRA